jgi:hypothetical protein
LAYPAEKRDQLGEDVIKAADLKPIDNFDWHPSDHRP